MMRCGSDTERVFHSCLLAPRKSGGERREDKEDLEVLRSFGANVDSSGSIDCCSELVPDINTNLFRDIHGILFPRR